MKRKLFNMEGGVRDKGGKCAVIPPLLVKGHHRGDKIQPSLRHVEHTRGLRQDQQSSLLNLQLIADR